MNLPEKPDMVFQQWVLNRVFSDSLHDAWCLILDNAFCYNFYFLPSIPTTPALKNVPNSVNY
jgi:hypothetical protein